eukprot:CAMPEP_0169311174 /NCGR_PEP_ID=MMETSP1017-20121227/3361_1 /TAXON_ID=342587 /ORGANISM="Karlodinium micrum, Strain CCMP2283" /LENGTH=469 /DNA_ID=CAMNT_0009404863 /DNA_START=71 /DNA_END=1477 /DNA_ORIENTATION=-
MIGDRIPEMSFLEHEHLYRRSAEIMKESDRKADAACSSLTAAVGMKLYPDHARALLKLHDLGVTDSSSLRVKPFGDTMGRLREQLGSMEASIAELSTGMQLEEESPKVRLQALKEQVARISATSRGQESIPIDVGAHPDSSTESKKDCTDGTGNISELIALYEEGDSPARTRLEFGTPSEKELFFSPIADTSKSCQQEGEDAIEATRVLEDEEIHQNQALEVARSLATRIERVDHARLVEPTMETVTQEQKKQQLPNEKLPHFAFVCSRLSQLEYAKAEQARSLDAMQQEFRNIQAQVSELIGKSTNVVQESSKEADLELITSLRSSYVPYETFETELKCLVDMVNGLAVVCEERLLQLEANIKSIDDRHKDSLGILTKRVQACDDRVGHEGDGRLEAMEMELKVVAEMISKVADVCDSRLMHLESAASDHTKMFYGLDERMALFESSSNLQSKPLKSYLLGTLPSTTE